MSHCIPHSPEARKKIGEANKGRIVSDETRRKLSEANKKSWASGKRKKRVSIETRKKISKARKERVTKKSMVQDELHIYNLAYRTLMEAKWLYDRGHQVETLSCEEIHKRYLHLSKDDLDTIAPLRMAKYQRTDREKGLTNDLDVEFVKETYKQGCYYCGDKAIRNMTLDRIDNTKGHTKDNCICACTQCNRQRKNLYTVEEFKALKENESTILNKKYTLEDLTLENMFS